MVFTNVGWDHPLDLFVAEKHSQPPAINSSIVWDNCEVFCSLLLDSMDEIHWDTTDSEATSQYDRSILNVLDCLCSRLENLAKMILPEKRDHVKIVIYLSIGSILMAFEILTVLLILNDCLKNRTNWLYLDYTSYRDIQYLWKFVTNCAAGNSLSSMAHHRSGISSPFRVILCDLLFG